MMSPCYCNTLRMATRRMSAAYDAALAPLGINIAQYALLRMIAGTAPMSLTDLGRSAELDRSTVGRNVRVLERMGLARTARGKDQREAVVTLTPAGAAILQQAGPLWDGCQRSIETRLGPEGIRLLDELLRAV